MARRSAVGLELARPATGSAGRQDQPGRRCQQSFVAAAPHRRRSSPLSAPIALFPAQVGTTNKVRRAEKEEKFVARKALAPFLQAEEDRR